MKSIDNQTERIKESYMSLWNFAIKHSTVLTLLLALAFSAVWIYLFMIGNPLWEQVLIGEQITVFVVMLIVIVRMVQRNSRSGG